MGALVGRKVLTLQTIPAREGEEYCTNQLGRLSRPRAILTLSMAADNAVRDELVQ